MGRRLLTSLMVVMLCILGVNAPALAKSLRPTKELLVATNSTYFVATDGSDSSSGTMLYPWATINHAARMASAGDMIVVRGGTYPLTAQVRPLQSGRAGAWITFVGYPGEQAVLDARSLERAAGAILNDGAFQIEGVSYVRVVNLKIINSRDAGFTIRDSSHVDLINNSTNGTFASGIAAWDTRHGRTTARHIRIMGNDISRANLWEAAGPGVVKRGEPPHEALSVGGAVDFEVAYNHVHDSGKEGIDIKETSSRGKVHHNLVQNVERQGLYVDAWFGELSDIELFDNVVQGCGGSGFALSAENGTIVQGINFHDNLIINNRGSGMYISRWGADNLRRDIQIVNNTFYHNGFGAPEQGQDYFWQTGGIYLYSSNLRHVVIRTNIFSENRGFQIGYSELFLNGDRSWQTVAREKNIQIFDNLIDQRDLTVSPINSGGNPIDQVKIYSVEGERALHGDPRFRKPEAEDFTPRYSVSRFGARLTPELQPRSGRAQFWWRRDFPPRLAQTHQQIEP